MHLTSLEISTTVERAYNAINDKGMKGPHASLFHFDFIFYLLTNKHQPEKWNPM